ncbi:MAG: hypothetical protein ACRC8P_00330 [Spiroplasma sp.]
METYFSGDVYSFDKRINWIFNFLSFLGPFLSSNFFKGPVLDILLPILTFLLPLLSEFIYLVIRGYYFKQKLKFILARKSYKINAIGMFIDSSFKVKPNEANKEVQLSDRYIIELFIEYDFWKASLKLIAKISIENSKTDGWFSKYVRYLKNLIKIINKNDENIIPLKSYHLECLLYYINDSYFVPWKSKEELKNNLIKCLNVIFVNHEKDFNLLNEINGLLRLNRSLTYNNYKTAILNLLILIGDKLNLVV